MGITVGKPTGPIQLPDIAKNRLAYKEFGLKRRRLELEEQLAQQKLNQGKGGVSKPTKPEISKIKPNFNEKFQPLHDSIMNQIDSYYFQYADELNPNNTADDNIPGVFNPQRARYISNFENSALSFAQHSNDWTTQANNMFSAMTELDEKGNPKLDLSLFEQHPVYLSVDRVNERISGISGYVGIDDPQVKSLWNGNPENGGKTQSLVLKEGGDPNDINDYLSKDGYFIDNNGNRIIEHGAYGKPAQSNQYLISDVFNQTIDPSFLGVDNNGNITYKGQYYYDYFDKKMWDQGKYIRKEQTNYIQDFAEKIKYTGLLEVDPTQPNRKIVTSKTFNNLRTQIIDGFKWDQNLNQGKGSWSSETSQQIAEQIARISLEMQGISNPSKGRVEDEYFKIMRNDELPGGKNGLIRTSQYDGYELKTYNDLVSELILEQFNGYKNFEQFNSSASTDAASKRNSSDWSDMMDNVSDMAFDTYNILGNQIKTGYGGAPPQAVVSKIKANQTWQLHQPIPDGDVSDQTYMNTGFITGSPEISSAITGRVGNFKQGNQVSLVAINRETGELMLGKWDKANQKFAVSNQYTKEQASKCIVVPCYYGEFQISKEEMKGIIANTPAEDLTPGTPLNQFLTGDGTVATFVPIHRIHSKDTYDYHYKEYIEMSTGISNNGIYYGDFNTDLTPSSGYKFPGGVFNN